MKSPKLVGLSLTIGTLTLVSGLIWHARPKEDPKRLENLSAKGHAKSSRKAPGDQQPFNLDTVIAKKPKDFTEFLPQGLTPERAKELIDQFFQKSPDIGERTKFCNAIIQSLCEQGYTEEAWNLIDQNSGQIRSNELFSFFAAAKLSSGDLLGRLATMDSDLSDCFGGYLKRYRADQLGTVLSSPELDDFFRKLGPDKTRQLNIGTMTALALQMSLPEGPSDPAPVLQSAAQLNASGILGSDAFISLVGKGSNLNAFDKWSYIKEVDRERESTPQTRKNRDKLISEMVGSNGPAALSAILESSGRQNREDIEAAVKSWVNIDSKGVAEWNQKNQSSMTQESRNIVASAFSSEALNSLEFDTARSWADQIKDPESKANAIKLIEEKMAEYQKAQAKESLR